MKLLVMGLEVYISLVFLRVLEALGPVLILLIVLCAFLAMEAVLVSLENLRV